MIYHGDCIEGLKTQGDGTIDLVITDPPYGTRYKTNHRKDKTHKFTTEIANDVGVHIAEQIVPELYRVMKPDTALYYFCSPDMIEHVKPIVAAHFKVKNVVIWVKNNWTAGDLKAQYGKRYEMIIYANKGRKYINGRRDNDVWFYDRVVGKKQVHQNQKPLDLIEYMINKSSAEGDTVLDPFMGSGTTAIASIRTNRKFVGYELDSFYYDAALRRIEEEHGTSTKTNQ